MKWFVLSALTLLPVVVQADIPKAAPSKRPVSQTLVDKIHQRCDDEQGYWLDFVSEKTGERIVGCVWIADQESK